MKLNKFIFIISLLSFIFSNNLFKHDIISNDDYITGEDGVIRMYININGHIKNPGTYLVYDGIDFMTVLSLAGGYIEGSNLKNIIVYSTDGNKKIINLNEITHNNNKDYFIDLKPHDTIFIKQKTFSKIFTSSNLPSILLSMLNIALTLERTK